MTHQDVRRSTKGRLEALSIPLHPHLPLRDENTLRAPADIGLKIIVHYALAGLAFGADACEVKKWLESEGIWRMMVSDDQAPFTHARLSNSLANELSWKKESLFVLAWACNIVPSLPEPSVECVLDAIFAQIPPERECASFIAGIQLRPPAEVVSELDFYYCLHAAIQHPEIWSPIHHVDKLNRGVVLERRQALEWLAHEAIAWQDISLDT